MTGEPEPLDEDDLPPTPAPERPVAPPGASTPVPESKPSSPAREYRRRRDRRRGPYLLLVVFVIAVAAVNLTLFYAQNLPVGANGTAPTGGGGPSPPGGTNGSSAPFVTLGAVRDGTTTCGSGESARYESVPWTSSQAPLTTSEVFLEVEELLDGDIDGGPAPAPSVTTGYLCAGSAPSANPSWYVVLQSPAGLNVAYYSFGTGWVSLDPGHSAVPFAPGSSLVLLADPYVGGGSFGLCVIGGVGSPSFNICASL